MIRSTGFRISVVFALVLSVTVALMGGFVYWATVDFMDRQTNTVIETDIEGLAEVYRSDGLNGLVRTIESRIERDPVRSSIYLVTDARRTPVVGNLSRWPAVAANESGWIEFSLKDARTGETARARTRPFLLRGQVNLLVGRDIRNLEQTKYLIERALKWGMVLASLVGIAAGWLLSRRLRRRLATITHTAREVMRGNLSQRVPHFGYDDDLDAVALSLNVMLERIQTLLHGIEHVSDNIAHDLRTPLARLRNRLADLRDGDVGSDATSASIDQCIVEVDQLLSTFAALLKITKLETQTDKLLNKTVALDEVARAALDLYEPVADDNGLKLVAKLAHECVRGDRELLLQSLCNVLDNAIKFSPTGGTIDITLDSTATHVRLSVRDEGAGIEASDRSRVFERFYRGDSARHTPGSGLGLSLVRAICDYHGGTIELQDAQPGLTVVMDFPLLPPAGVPKSSSFAAASA